MPKRSTTSTWNGTLKEGNGVMRLQSGSYEGPFTFASRFEEGNGTNPEELAGAALSGCFSMFLSALISKQDLTPNSIETKADVTINSTDNGPEITEIQLTCNASVPGIEDNLFQDLVTEAKAKCPISKLFAGTTITVSAVLN